MSKWDDEKTKVKDIFDAVRNFGISGLVFYLGMHSFMLSSKIGMLTVAHKFLGVVFVSLGVYLFWINLVSFHKTINEAYESRAIGSIFFFCFPVFAFMLGVSPLLNSALSMEIKGGGRLGEVTISDLLRDGDESENADSSQKSCKNKS